MSLKQKLFTVWVFFKINLRRLFRDRLALFFTFLFPLIFLFVFGGIFGNHNGVSFNIAVISHSNTKFSKQFVKQLDDSKVIKVNQDVKDLATATDKMSRSEIDATIVLPSDFGQVKNHLYPSGEAIIRYTQNNETAAQTLASILQAQFAQINTTVVKAKAPFTVKTKEVNIHSLTQFDYTFTGLLGFAILGAGIFGPMNVFPELKKQGILRRLHTTPIRVWQYFLANMFGNAVTGLMSIAIMFIVAVGIFHLHMIGNYLELALFLAFGIIMILGIGLALGGWAKNERQAAPLGNIIVFPLMFLSGTFFPRFLFPHWLQDITGFFPLTPVIDGARLIVTQGAHLTGIGTQLLIMAIWTVIIYVIAFRVFRWE